LLTAEQGKAILEMKLQRLTGLERDKIRKEMEELKELIAYLQKILDNKLVLQEEIVKELEEVKRQYGDDRRSVISGAIDILTEADLIPDEDVVVTLTKKGYIKRVLLSVYGVQHRGGKGKMGVAAVGDADDLVKDIFVTRNHDDLLFFTNLGRIYGMQVFEIPEASRIAKGRAVINLLPLAPGEHVVKLLCAHELQDKFVVMLTRQGIIKRTSAQAFQKIRVTGIRALTLREDDELVFCDISSGNDEIIIATAHGQGIHFNEQEVRAMGRQAAGVMGIRVRKGDKVVGMEVIADQDKDVLFATQNGYGKRVKVRDFRLSHRGGVGVRTIPADARNGFVVGIVAVGPESNILLIDTSGKIIRLLPKEVRTMGRQARGVRLIRLDKGQKLISVVAFEEHDEALSEDEACIDDVREVEVDTAIDE
jgi:DNA gyrase subunit A